MLGLLVVAAACLGASHAGSQPVDPELTRRPQLERDLARVMVALDAQPANCHASLLGVPLGHALCGDAPDTMKKRGAELRERLEMELAKLADLELSDAGWQKDRATSRGEFRRRGDRVVVGIRHKSAQLALSYPPVGTGCLPDEAREGAVDSEAEWPLGFAPPKAIDRVHAEYPEEARVMRISGSVLVGYRIEATGEVSELCVAMTDDRTAGQSLVRSALQAARATRYRPGRLDGRPVAVIGSSTTRFQLGF